MMSVRFIDVHKLTRHCFNISRVGVSREGRLHLKVLLLLEKQNCHISQIGCWFLAFLLPACPFGIIRRIGRYSWEGGLVNLIRERCTS